MKTRDEVDRAVDRVRQLLQLGDRNRDHGALFAALATCESALAAAPSRRDAIDLRIRIAHRLGAVARARELRDENPGSAGPVDRKSMDGDYAASLLRWGRIDAELSAAGLARTTRALGLLSEASTRRSRFDRIHGLLALSRTEEVLQDYQRLRAEGLRLPPYVLFDVADAMAQHGRPVEASRLLREGLEQDPTNYAARLSLVYACCDLWDFDTAIALVDAMYAAQGAWLWKDGRREPEADYRKLDLAIAAALVRLFAGEHEAAQSRLEELRERAPASAYIRRELANVYLARGWHRLAREEHGIAATLAGHEAVPAVGAGWASLRLHDFTAALQEIEELARVSPQSRGLADLERAWRRHDSAELRVVGRVGKSDGSTFGSRDHSLESTLFSAPVFDQYRIFVRSWLAYARFPEGDEHQSRAGLGFDCRAPGLELLGELHAETAADHDVGFALSGRWHLDDRWSLPFAFELVSKATPLRALKQGVDADAFQVGLSWRQHEARRADASFRLMELDDGNSRVESMLRYSQELYDSGQTRVRGGLDLYYGTNTESNVAYYSPGRDVTANLEVAVRQELFRNTSRSFAHQIAVEVGQHWQEGFSPGTTASVGYRHYLGFAERFDLEYGVLWARRVYDGDVEAELAGTIALSWRF